MGPHRLHPYQLNGTSWDPKARRKDAVVMRCGGEILLVEDDPDGVLLIKRALRKNGFDNAVVVARDGKEALEHLVDLDGPTSTRLVLLDLRLPKVDGLEVLTRLRAAGRAMDLPVVLMVSSERELEAIADRGVGLANLCIEKAVDFDCFVRAVGGLRDLLPVEVAAPGHERGWRAMAEW